MFVPFFLFFGFYISIYVEEDITIINIYATNIESLKYIKEILTIIKGEIDSNTIIVGDFNTLTSINRSTRQKINKEILALNDITPNGLNKST